MAASRRTTRAPARRPRSRTRPLLAATLPGGVRYAPGIRTDRWVFATGHKGVADFGGPMAADVVDADAPRHGAPKYRKEAERLYANLARVLEAGGTDRRNTVRVDQYYTHWRAVDPYHDVRRAFFAGAVPASTSNLHRRFLLPGQDIEVQLIAAVPAPGFEPKQFRPEGFNVHPTSGYSTLLTCGDYVFVAGQTSEALVTAEGPLDPSARMPAGHLWKGTPIKLETEFVLSRKLAPALALIGNRLEDVVKAQVYLRDLDDAPAFNEVWSQHFGESVPATTIITTADPGFICETGRIEINTISVRRGGRTRAERIEAGVPTVFAGHPQAIRAGDLLFLSGLCAVDARGALATDVRVDPRQPYFGSAVELQMERILDHAEAVCRKAGTALANVVRVQQFHTDLADFHGAWRVWDRRLPGAYLPFSAIETPALPVPGAVVMLDLWVAV